MNIDNIFMLILLSALAVYGISKLIDNKIEENNEILIGFVEDVVDELVENINNSMNESIDDTNKNFEHVKQAINNINLVIRQFDK